MVKLKSRRKTSIKGGDQSDPIESLWAKTGSLHKGPADALLAHYLSNDLIRLMVKAVRANAISRCGHASVVGIYGTNHPKSVGDTLAFVPLDEFKRRAVDLAILPQDVFITQRLLDVGNFLIPPICVLWFDGIPDGNFVSQMLLTQDGPSNVPYL